VFFVCFGLACLGVVRNVLAEDLESEAAAAAATCALVPVAVAPYLGMAEGPFIAYAATGILFVRRGLFRDSPRQITLGAVLLGLAASTKNEGITLVLAAIVAGALAIGPRTMLKLWPAVAIPLPWIIIRQFHGLATDLTTGDIGPRVLQHLQNADEILLAIGRTPFGKPFFWIGIAVGLATGGLALVRRERFLLGTVAIQYLFYLGAYFVTPHDIEWHVKWSWERVLNQMTLLLAFAAISAVMLELLRRDENGKTV
jgi:hypothetical protein